LLTVEEAAELKAVHRQSVRVAIREGRLPAVMKGRMYFVARADLDAWTVVRHRPKKSDQTEQE
jgi:excisionase family DNA binding protein